MERSHILFGHFLQEQTHHPSARCQHQGCGTLRSRLVLVGPGLAEQTHHRQVAAFRRHDQGRGVINRL
eukprot:3206118-Heterocapsa_arctica.AAC.1